MLTKVKRIRRKKFQTGGETRDFKNIPKAAPPDQKTGLGKRDQFVDKFVSEQIKSPELADAANQSFTQQSVQSNELLAGSQMAAPASVGTTTITGQQISAPTAITSTAVTAPTGITTSTMTPAMGEGGGGTEATWECNFGNPSNSISSGNADANAYGNFEYEPPSGYYSLCTKNLAQYG